jgi:hypothetical protein
LQNKTILHSKFNLYLFSSIKKTFLDKLVKLITTTMATLDQYVGNIRQLSLEGKFRELAQTLTNPTIDHLNKNIQHIDSILATFTLPEYSMVKSNISNKKTSFDFLFHSVC